MVVALLAGCSTGSGPTARPSKSSENSRYYATYLAEATSNHASARQIEVLKEAVRTGDLTFETVNELTRITFDCFAQNGISYDKLEPIELGIGYYMPNYAIGAESAGRTEKETTAVADQCINTESYWASMAQQDIRMVGQARDARMRRDLPNILACLKKNGVAMADDAALDEIRRAVKDLALGNDASGAKCYDDFQT